MAQPIYNPTVPYVGPMRLFPRQMLKIEGTPNFNATRFAINLQTGPNVNPRDDIALHLGVTFNPRMFKRNSLIFSSWGKEENVGPFPFNPGQRFDITILCEEHEFRIAINGYHHCEYLHRVNKDEISYLTIDGEVSIHSISVFESGSMPLTHPPSAGYPNQPSMYPSLPNQVPYPQPGFQPSGYPSHGQYPPSGQYLPSGPYPPPPPPQPHGYPYPGYQHPRAGIPPFRSNQPSHPTRAPHPSTSSGHSFLSGMPSGLKAAAGLGLGVAAGAAALSVASHPFKKAKKFKKKIKHGWKSSSSSSSSSSSD